MAASRRCGWNYLNPEPARHSGAAVWLGCDDEYPHDGRSYRDARGQGVGGSFFFGELRTIMRFGEVPDVAMVCASS
jgi:hypothetical protein